MTAFKISIKYKKYNRIYPDIVSEDEYYHFKNSSILLKSNLKVKFVIEFFSEILFIVLGIISAIAFWLDLIRRNSVSEWICGILFLVGIYSAFSFFFSLTSFAGCQ